MNVLKRMWAVCFSEGSVCWKAFQKLLKEEWKACGNECHEEYCQDLSLKDQIFVWITHQNSWEC